MRGACILPTVYPLQIILLKKKEKHSNSPMHQLTNYVYIIIIQNVSEPMHVVIIMIERQQSLTHTRMHFILIIHRIEYVCAWIKWENTEKKMKKIAYKNWLDFETMWHLTDEPFIYTFFHSTVGSLHIFVFALHLTFVWHLRRKYCNIIQPLNEIRKKKIVPAWRTQKHFIVHEFSL